MKVEEVMKKHPEAKLASQVVAEDELQVLAARFQYLLYLNAGLKEWKVVREDESAKLEALQKEIINYLDYLSTIINKVLDKKQK